MEIWQNILNGNYTIRDFDDLSPEAESFTDSIMADWTGFYYDYSEFPELNMGEEVSGFIKVTNNEKLRIKLYLDDGDGIFSKEDDILLGKRKGNVDAKKGLRPITRAELLLSTMKKLNSIAKVKSFTKMVFGYG